MLSLVSKLAMSQLHFINQQRTLSYLMIINLLSVEQQRGKGVKDSSHGGMKGLTTLPIIIFQHISYLPLVFHWAQTHTTAVLFVMEWSSRSPDLNPVKLL